MTEDTDPSPVLPVPAALYDEIGALKENLYALQAQLGHIEQQYDLLDANLDSVDVDDLGDPTTAADEIEDVAAWLINAHWDLTPVGRWIECAHQHASRLRLTDRAAARYGARFSH